MVEPQPSKLTTGVRFPSSAPKDKIVAPNKCDVIFLYKRVNKQATCQYSHHYTCRKNKNIMMVYNCKWIFKLKNLNHLNLLIILYKHNIIYYHFYLLQNHFYCLILLILQDIMFYYL